MGKELSLLDFFIVLAKHKIKILINFIFISIVALIIALCLTKLYKSEVVFIPKSNSSSGLFSLIGNNLTADFIGGSSLSKRQYKSVLYSRELREKLIKKFNLVEVYELTDRINPIDYSLKMLKKNIVIEEESEGGLGITDVVSLTIRVIDKDPQLASDMANYIFVLLEEKVLELNKNEFDNVTEFLDLQIAQCEQKLDSTRQLKKDFQFKNKAYNISQQVSMVLQAFGTTKAEILSLDNKIYYLESIHSKDYNGISTLKQKKRAFEQKLREMENSQKNDVFVGLTKSLDLSDEFIDLVTEVETYTHLRSLLKQQLEQAKIKQSKNFSPLYIIDNARPAEYKFKPKRAVVILVIVFIYMFFYISILLLWDHYLYIKKHTPEKLHRINILLDNLSFKKK